MSELAVIARMTAVAGRRDELIRACRSALDVAATEAGTLEYRLHVDTSDEDVVWFYERYRDRAAFDEHASSEGMRAFGRSVADLLGTRPEVSFVAPVAEAGGAGT